MARKIFIKLRADEQEQAAWKEYAERQGKPLSAILREYMERCLEREAT